MATGGTVRLPGVTNFDLVVKEDNFDSTSLQILKVIRPEWELSKVKREKFTGGLNNILICVSMPSDPDWEDALLFRIRPDSAIGEFLTPAVVVCTTNMYLAHCEGCGPRLDAVFTNGMVHSYTQGKILTPQQVREPHIGRLVARELVRLHAIDPRKYEDSLGAALMEKVLGFTPVTEFHGLLQMMPEKYTDPNKEVIYRSRIPTKEEITKELDVLVEDLKNLPSTPYVICHHDLVPNNIVYNSKTDRCHLIDMEMLGMNVEAFDLASFFCEWIGTSETDLNFDLFPNKEEQFRWLRDFLEEKRLFIGQSADDVTDHDVEMLYVHVNKYTQIHNMMAAIWALAQAEDATIDFDFLGLAEAKIGLYMKRKHEVMALKIPE